MKKPFVLIAAIVAVVGLGGAVAVAKETAEVGTSVSIKLKGSNEHYSFFGKVKAKEGCHKERRVVVHNADSTGSPGAVRSDNRGRYQLELIRPLHGNRYFVTTKKKIIKKDGERIVCKKARSKTVDNQHPAPSSH